MAGKVERQYCCLVVCWKGGVVEKGLMRFYEYNE